MATAVKEEVFELGRNTVISGSTLISTGERDLAAATVDYSPQTIWEFPVPVGQALVFTGEDIVSAYLEDNDTEAECIGTTVYVDVVVMDSSKQNVRSILNLCQYGNMKEFAEVTKLQHLDIAPGDQVIANEGERVCFRVNSRTSAEATLDASDSYFRLTCKRVRHTLF